VLERVVAKRLRARGDIEIEEIVAAMLRNARCDPLD